MSGFNVLVTGAGGFIGSHLVRTLLDKGCRVRAAVHHPEAKNIDRASPLLEIVPLDILDRPALISALQGIDHLYHFAAKIGDNISKHELYRINVEGTRNVWETACQMGLKKALYCSTTAVYGLLCGNHRIIHEKIMARAIQTYGRSKLEGEKLVREISSAYGLDYIIIRPAAVFGPGEHTHFGERLRSAAFSRLLLSGGFKERRFSYVHAEDVAMASVHLMQQIVNKDPVFNIAVNEPISYEEAFKAYMNMLDKPGFEYMKLRWLGKLAIIVEQLPEVSCWTSLKRKLPFAFRIWQPGFDMTFSSEKLLSTSFQFHWNNFADILASCLPDNRLRLNTIS